MSQDVKLTEYSHGAGCGCKISPQVLSTILQSKLDIAPDPKLLVGNSTRDDAAAYDMGNGQVVLSTTDFFMPICDDPFDFGRIAATNAISDIYAMGGQPLMAIAIFGWPINKLSAEVAQQVIDGGRQACADAGIMLAGGHSIDAPEPIFGLAVTGQVEKQKLKQNDTAREGDVLMLTKPLGVGILTTAQKQKKLLPEHNGIAIETMCQMNKIGPVLAGIKGVNAITDVTGFGLAGHLIEMSEGADLYAKIQFDKIPTLPHVHDYLSQGCVPGGSSRNFDSYGQHISPVPEHQRNLLCDPQTSGGLLISVAKEDVEVVYQTCREHNQLIQVIGELYSAQSKTYRVVVE
ncbi:selenide, water dikinase SelD [Idiomarina abyssalis]|uniref:selenide, water dikinase SelD n=1 Tax=Idiomarina abyssalis TaxID=86102 RepID=UPI00241F2DA4|nr:selenide, water dikinase SelD [Idiomarina abyssalis]|tara:strand:- start:79139 stop:80179 length:1041 start_codon:yes stop_codon:yes gene_type:complete